MQTELKKTRELLSQLSDKVLAAEKNASDLETTLTTERADSAARIIKLDRETNQLRAQVSTLKDELREKDSTVDSFREDAQTAKTAYTSARSLSVVAHGSSVQPTSLINHYFASSQSRRVQDWKDQA